MIYKVTTEWDDGERNTLIIEAEDRKEANRVAQASLNQYEKIVQIEET